MYILIFLFPFVQAGFFKFGRLSAACGYLPQLLIHAKAVDDLPVPSEPTPIKIVHGRSGHSDLFSGGRKSRNVTLVCAGPEPCDNDRVSIGEEFVYFEALIRKWCARLADTLFVAPKIKRFLLPRIARIVMDRILRCDIFVGSFDIAVVPYFFYELRQDLFCICRHWHRYHSPSCVRELFSLPERDIRSDFP